MKTSLRQHKDILSVSNDIVWITKKQILKSLKRIIAEKTTNVGTSFVNLFCNTEIAT